MNIRRMISPYVLPFFVMLVYLILYIPIIVLILFSFNETPFVFKWNGLSLKWYYKLFQSVEILSALKNSLIVAFSAVLLSSIMGLFYVFFSTNSFLNKWFIMFYGGLIAPEIVLAVGLLSFFSFFSVSLGIITLIIGHTIIGLGYVVPMIRTRFVEIDYSLIEASLDLGATQIQTFFKIVIPLLSPALISAGLLVLIISLDDFLISFFCAGSSTLTLPMYIFSVIRSGASPVVNALSTVLLVVSGLLILILTSLKVRTRIF